MGFDRFQCKPLGKPPVMETSVSEMIGEALTNLNVDRIIHFSTLYFLSAQLLQCSAVQLLLQCSRISHNISLFADRSYIHDSSSMDELSECRDVKIKPNSINIQKMISINAPYDAVVLNISSHSWKLEIESANNSRMQPIK